MGKNRENKKCRRSAPFRDCRFPQAGDYGKNLPFGKLTNEFAPSITAPKEKRTRVPLVGTFQGLPFPASGSLRQKFAFRQIDERVRPLNNGTKEKRTRPSLVLFSFGAAGRGRTDTVSLPRDFESRASANSTTAAYSASNKLLYRTIIK